MIDERQLSDDERCAYLAEARDRGDLRVVDAIDGAQTLAAAVLSRDDLLGLCWQDSPPVRALVPRGEPRRVGDVARRFVERGYTWEGFVQGDVSRDQGDYDPGWFDAAAKYAIGEMDLDAGVLLLVDANESEQRSAQGATHYIWDGVHRALVAGVLYLQGGQYKPLHVLVVRPRPVG